MRQLLKHWLVAASVSLTAGFAFGQTPPTRGPAQVPVFEHLSIADGIPDNSVRAIVQDHQGFLWLGGSGTLARYDGYESRNFRHDPTDSLSLGLGEIRVLFVDSEGVLWVGMSQSGLHRFDSETETFAHFRHDPENPGSLSAPSVADIRQDRSGKLWLITKTGPTSRESRFLDRFNPATGEVDRFRHDPQDPTTLGPGELRWMGNGNSFLTYEVGLAGDVWIGTRGGGLNRFVSETNTFEHFTHDPADPYSLSDDGVLGIHEDRLGRLWVATESGLNLLNRTEGTFQRFSHATDVPNSENLNHSRHIHEDSDGNLWVTTRGGLTRFDPDTGKFKLFLHDPSDAEHPGHSILLPFIEDLEGDFWFFTSDVRRRAPRILNHFDRDNERLSYFRSDPAVPGSLGGGGRLETLLADRSGVIWIGSWGGGLNKYDRSGQKFGVLRDNSADPNSLRSENVQALWEDRNGTIWIGTNGGGVSALDRGRGELRHFGHDPEDPFSLSSDQVSAVLEDRAGAVWVGTSDAGLNRLDRATGRFTHFKYSPTDSTSLSTPVVFSLYEDDGGVLWVGARGNGSETETGIQRFDPAESRFVHYARSPHSGRDMAVFSIAQDFSGGMWLGSNLGGLQHLDPTTGTVSSYQAAILPYGGSISAVSRSHTGAMWVGSVNDGFVSFDPSTMQSQMSEAMPGASIRSLIEDDGGTLWIGTSNGLSRFVPETGVLTSFDESDGLPSTAFNGGAALRAADGTLFFGTEKGLVSFRPEELAKNLNQPQLVLTGFSLFDRVVSPGPESPLTTEITQAESVSLRHYENDFSFSFAALHYSSPGKNEYAFKLEPYEDVWREVGTRRVATYMNLEPGAYTFRVRGSNNDGVWSDAAASIRVNISPPWWRTAWAYMFYGILVLAGLAAANRLQRRHLIRGELERGRIKEAQLKAEAAEAHAQVLEELDQTKSRFFANISHEFRTPLTLILGPIRDLLDGTLGPIDDRIQRQHRRIHQSGNRLLRLINQLLDLSKLESGSMTLLARPGNLVPFLKRVVGAFASRAERRSIELTFESETGEIELYFEEDKLEKILSNLLSNAFKFTPDGGSINVTARTTGRAGVELVVADTGEGIPADELPRIFDRFMQVDGSSTRQREGTGIGLALTQELVALHGGTIRVESRVGEGTRFFVSLPQGANHLTDAEIAGTDEVIPEIDPPAAVAAVAAVAVWEDQVEESLEVPPLDAPLVLVVEDNPDVRSYLLDHLAPLYRVEEAVDGLEGLEKARKLQPALVISDVMMPHMDGYQLCELLKTDKKLNHIPVILLTAKADEESKVEGLETGADDYIYKPFSAAELLARSENLIEIRRLLRDRYAGEVVLSPSDLAVPSAEAAFLVRVRDVVEEQMGNRNFGVDWLADDLGVSTRQLQRRLKTGMRLSPSGYIRTMRLQRAAQLLEGGVGNVSEAAHAVGFQDLKHFSNLFRQVFGVLPSRYPLKEA